MYLLLFTFYLFIFKKKYQKALYSRPCTLSNLVPVCPPRFSPNPGLRDTQYHVPAMLDFVSLYAPGLFFSYGAGELVYISTYK